MRYERVVEGIFKNRPNRFIAFCDVAGTVQKVHVKNTGRCRELLIPGVKVVLSISDNPLRSTAYDLIAVFKGSRLVNIDSQAPNAVVKESFPRICPCDTFQPEFTFGESRFDFSAVRDGKRIFVEVKGVTQEDRNHVMFPDAPTDRGLKHVRELTDLSRQGYEGYIVFVIQMSDVDFFVPNYEIHRDFGIALKEASDAGVRVMAFDSQVTEDSMVLGDGVEVRF